MSGLLAAAAAAIKVAPPAPLLAYTAQGSFTISDYDAAKTYVVSGATRSGNTLTGVANGATITVSNAPGTPQSAPSTMYVANHGRVLDAIQQYLSDAGCGTRSNKCCSSNWIINTNGATCGGAPGTQGDFCGGSCPGNCYGFFNVACWSWHWTDYTASGYTLLGSVWGKAVRG